MKLASPLWHRDPLYGGCCYHLGSGSGSVTVSGWYSPYEFEADCHEWFASNIGGQSFPTAEAAMLAAEAKADEEGA